MSYALVSNAAVHVLDCNGEGYLRADPTVVCYEGVHKDFAVPLAIATIIFYVIAFPFTTTLFVWQSRQRWHLEGSLAWGYLLDNDYQAKYFFFKQIHLVLLGVLGK